MILGTVRSFFGWTFGLGSFFAGLGAYLFSRSGSLVGLVVARAFIGFGVSACLMAAFKA